MDLCYRVIRRVLVWAHTGILGVPHLLIVVRRGRKWKNSIKVRIAVSVADPAIAATVEFG